MNRFILFTLAAGSVVSSAIFCYHFLADFSAPIEKKRTVVSSPAITTKNPTLVLSPNTVNWHQKIIVKGHNFCRESNCSPVTIKLEELVLKANIVLQNGSFETTVKIDQPARIRDSYRLVAQQKNANGILTETASELKIYPDEE